MKGRTAKRWMIIGAAVFFFSAGIWWFTRPSTPQSQFDEYFADLSTGVPAHVRILSFNQPADAVKGDFCSVEFVQTAAQFNQFVTHFGVSREGVLSSTGVWVKANSRLNPQYSWMLQIKAERYDSAGNDFKVRIEGRQPYNNPNPKPPAKTN